MQDQYPETEIVKDIDSGLNYKRKGLKAILERAMWGERIELVVAYRDRLTKFGFEFIEWIIEKNGGKLMVLDQSIFSPEQELTKDILSILHIFSARLHGLRSYKDKIKQALSNEGTKENIP